MERLSQPSLLLALSVAAHQSCAATSSSCSCAFTQRQNAEQTWTEPNFNFQLLLLISAPTFCFNEARFKNLQQPTHGDLVVFFSVSQEVVVGYCFATLSVLWSAHASGMPWPLRAHSSSTRIITDR